MNRSRLTAARLRELLRYDPLTGFFRWAGPKVGRDLGCPIGSGRKPNSYIRISLSDERHYAHRLVWLYIYGTWPEHGVDHINGVRSDNRLSNLRDADQTHNAANVGAYRTNTSGYRGVYRHHDGRWRAKIKAHREYVHLGLFATPEEASEAYKAAAKNYYGDFARCE